MANAATESDPKPHRWLVRGGIFFSCLFGFLYIQKKTAATREALRGPFQEFLSRTRAALGDVTTEARRLRASVRDLRFEFERAAVDAEQEIERRLSDGSQDSGPADAAETPGDPFEILRDPTAPPVDEKIERARLVVDAIRVDADPTDAIELAEDVAKLEPRAHAYRAVDRRLATGYSTDEAREMLLGDGNVPGDTRD
jgi:hypothetical protein